MPATLPVPIAFHLPEGWEPAAPEEGDAPGVAFAAVLPQSEGFTSNITVDGMYLSDGATLADIADASVERLREMAGSVMLADRREVGSAEAPALTQRLTFSGSAGGLRHDLVQSQVYLGLVDVTDPSRRAVVRLALTADADRHDDVVGDFQEFVRSVRPDTEGRA
ncbi:hypothetical protein ABZ771_12025 [Streptomyces globisporus]|uniref:hypothetical protein n=1 Tax=Streptomyces albovinaceus subgroup TaxID=1482558 RepID=UPI0004CA1E78|nr:hypothetical protein [Streptomyces mediolani]WSV91503.1 hypothetical protein OG449_20415 [Streptomyces globisporus]GGW09902.1 hypothetical protein GCM10010264_40420 [Streptomyces globisporus]